MSNCKAQAERLLKGETVKFRPVGNSMRPKIESKALVTVSPDIEEIVKGDIVLCKVNGYYCVHLVGAVKGNQYQITNAKGYVNGWITKNGIYGKVIEVEN
jgi:hypothetical protein